MVHDLGIDIMGFCHMYYCCFLNIGICVFQALPRGSQRYSVILFTQLHPMVLTAWARARGLGSSQSFTTAVDSHDGHAWLTGHSSSSRNRLHLEKKANILSCSQKSSHFLLASFLFSFFSLLSSAFSTKFSPFYRLWSTWRPSWYLIFNVHLRQERGWQKQPENM